MSGSSNQPSASSVVGSNGVALTQYDYSEPGYRTYEVYQRERVGESTELINGTDLVSSEFALDPYPAFTKLREHYPCYRDWVNNCYWVTRYDDVTSVLADTANFESRPNRWLYGLPELGEDFGAQLPVLEAWAQGLQANGVAVAERLCEELPQQGSNFATQFAAQFAARLLALVVGVPERDQDRFAMLHRRMVRGAGWMPSAQQAGLGAIQELTSYFDQQMDAGGAAKDDGNLMGAVRKLGGSGKDMVATLLEADMQTLQGGLANLWALLLSHPDQHQLVREEPRLLKVAYLETLRHSTPIIAAQRFARHEVERFGRLLPQGALVICAAAAANRDPRVFDEPERFLANRPDICHREARGQYRADGLATGITPALGLPSKEPAVPEDRPISGYALVRDTVVSASQVVSSKLGDIRLAPGATPSFRSLTVGEMHCCWSLPILFERA